jgi:hypothetical protein
MRDEQYHTRQTIDGQEVDVANVGNPPSPPGVRCHICSVCRLSFSEDKMTQYQGKWYGIPCDCYRDIRTLRRRGKDLRVRSRRKEESS